MQNMQRTDFMEACGAGERACKDYAAYLKDCVGMIANAKKALLWMTSFFAVFCFGCGLSYRPIEKDALFCVALPGLFFGSLVALLEGISTIPWLKEWSQRIEELEGGAREFHELFVRFMHCRPIYHRRRHHDEPADAGEDIPAENTDEFRNAVDDFIVLRCRLPFHTFKSRR